MKQLFPKQATRMRSGVTLLVALLVLATVAGIALAIAAVVVRDVHQSRNLDDAITAYYAAEAGMEEALLKIKTNRLVTPGDPGLGSTLVDLDNDSGTVGSAVYSLDATEGPDILLTSIPQDEFVQADLFTPDPTFEDPGVENIRITWEGAGVSPTTWLEVAVERFLLAPLLTQFYRVESGEFVPSERQNFLIPCDSGGSPLCASGWCACDETTTEIWEGSGTRQLRIQIKALYGNARNVQVTALDSDNSPVPLRNRIQVTSKGTFARSNVAIQTSVPWRIPAGGLFAHVLFSEEDLAKD